MTTDERQVAVNDRAVREAAERLHATGWVGTPNDERIAPSLQRRISVDPETNCWLWTGARSSSGGYGDVRVGGKYDRIQKVHRVIYELVVGPIPAGLELDHLCRVRLCCNPTHLEPVTHRENILRGVAPPAIGARATHCPKGHPYAGDNLRINGRGARCCRECARLHQEDYKARIGVDEYLRLARERAKRRGRRTPEQQARQNERERERRASERAAR